jgi:hypothetical protein
MNIIQFSAILHRLRIHLHRGHASSNESKTCMHPITLASKSRERYRHILPRPSSAFLTPRLSKSENRAGEGTKIMAEQFATFAFFTLAAKEFHPSATSESVAR